MKKVVMMALIVAIWNASFAQTSGERTIQGSRMITKDSTPQQVIDTLKKRFPNAEAVQYFQTSAATAKGWTVTSEDNIEAGADLDFYTIKFKRNDFQYYGLFRADGTLVKSEFQQVNVELPDVVKTSLKKLAADKNYVGYTIISKDYWKVENYSKHKDFYVIRAIKKDDPTQAKTVTVDPAGNIVKVQ
jgi:hypothetical protein